MRTCCHRKQATLALFALSLLVMASCVFAGWRYAMDSWRIWQLGSPDWLTRVQAAEKLSERRCLRAVPEILKMIAEDTGEGTMSVIEYGAFTPSPTTDDDVAFVGGFATPRKEYRQATPLILALWNMGEAALPAFEAAARDWRDRIQDLQGSEEIANAQRVLSILDQLRDRTTRMEADEMSLELGSFR